MISENDFGGSEKGHDLERDLIAATKMKRYLISSAVEKIVIRSRASSEAALS